MDYERIKRLYESGMNIMPLNADKTPKKKWTDYQTERSPMPHESDLYALICGFDGIEVIDVDLKVIPELLERKSFFDELTGMIKDNIEDAGKKLMVVKTMNHGYHILYRAENIQGNQKLARLKGQKEHVIETRGVGGYVVMYDNAISLNYESIQTITDEEREIIINVCRTFNDDETHEEQIHIPVAVTRKYAIDNSGKTPWDDYNDRTNIFDIIRDEFTVVQDKHNKTLIRRHGAKSPHSGYVFKNSGCMYLFSTGTIYPDQKLVTPFIAYAIKNHNGNFSEAASILYSRGFGDRKKPVIALPEIKRPKPEPEVFPIDIFPKEITHYLLECKRTLHNSIDYMGCSLLWIGSLVIGNTLRIEVKKGWHEISTIWLALVGDAGLGKSPSINSILFPLEKINGEERRRYAKQRKAYEEYNSLTKQEKEKVVEVMEPKRTQFIVDDVTIEALINLHSQNPHGVGVFKDELAGWFKDMNKYKEGSDKEAWLSSWSGKGIAVDRITRQSDYIAKPILPVLGGIQPGIIALFFTSENKDSGFLDRMLFSYPDLQINNYIDDEIDEKLINFYNEFIVMFYQNFKKLTNFNDFDEIEPLIAKWTPEAKKEWKKAFNEITKMQNSDDTSEIMKSVLAKHKSYIPRFALIINSFNQAWEGNDITIIEADSVRKAFQLSQYFFKMNEKLILNNLEINDIKTVINTAKNSIYEKLDAIIKHNPNFNKKAVAAEFGVSRVTLYKMIEELKSVKSVK